jgi:hypothetical protein
MALIHVTPSPLAARWLPRDVKVILREVREGRLRNTFSLLAAFAAFASGFESYAQHQRGAFDDWLMWTPVALTPPMVVACALSLVNERLSRVLLPWVSLAIAIDGLVGFYAHLQGVARLPGGYKLAIYNITMGPPIFAPLFFLSVGLLGWLAALARPEQLDELKA